MSVSSFSLRSYTDSHRTLASTVPSMVPGLLKGEERDEFIDRQRQQHGLSLDRQKKDLARKRSQLNRWNNQLQQAKAQRTIIIGQATKRMEAEPTQKDSFQKAFRSDAIVSRKKARISKLQREIKQAELELSALRRGGFPDREMLGDYFDRATTKAYKEEQENKASLLDSWLGNL